MNFRRSTDILTSKRVLVDILEDQIPEELVFRGFKVLRRDEVLGGGDGFLFTLSYPALIEGTGSFDVFVDKRIIEKTLRDWGEDDAAGLAADIVKQGIPLLLKTFIPEQLPWSQEFETVVLPDEVRDFLGQHVETVSIQEEDEEDEDPLRAYPQTAADFKKTALAGKVLLSFRKVGKMTRVEYTLTFQIPTPLTEVL